MPKSASRLQEISREFTLTTIYGQSQNSIYNHIKGHFDAKRVLGLHKIWRDLTLINIYGHNIIYNRIKTSQDWARFGCNYYIWSK